MATLVGYVMTKIIRMSMRQQMVKTKIKIPEQLITKIKVPGMIMKIKVPGMNMKIKLPGMNMKLKVPDLIRAGCGTLMSKSCFSRRRVTLEPPLERKPSWSNGERRIGRAHV